MSDQKRLKMIIFICLMIVFGAMSAFSFTYKYNYYEQERLKQVNLPATDVSKIDINGQKINEYFNGDATGVTVYCENGTSFGNYWQLGDKEYIPSKVKTIHGALFGDTPCRINFDNQQIFTVEQGLDILGKNYLENYKYSREIIYLDHINGIRLTFTNGQDGREFIEMKKISSSIYKRTNVNSDSRIIDFLLRPSWVFWPRNKYMFISLIDYVLLPVFYSLLMFPIVYAFFRPSKKIIFLSILIISYLLLSHFVIIPMLISMSV